MSYQNIISNRLNQFSPGEIIIASALYKQMSSIPELAFYKVLERMVKTKALIRLTKGVYSIAEKSAYGINGPSEQKIIRHYIGPHSEYGVIIGYTLYNKYGLTTQISKKTEIYSSLVESETKTINNISIKKMSFRPSEKERVAIETFEILQNFERIENLSNNALRVLINNLANNYNDQAVQNVLSKMRYKKRTIAFLAAILDSRNIKHSLRQYLSGTSNYKIPRLEDFYAIT